MQPTELIHEAYLRLIVDDKEDQWEGQLHFTRVAARAMRFVLVDHARAKMSKKRGGGRSRVTLDTRMSAIADNAEQVLFVHDGLEQLAGIDEQLAKIVELRFFGGLEDRRDRPSSRVVDPNDRARVAIGAGMVDFTVRRR